MVWPETATVPEDAVTYPAEAPVVVGALQPAGTVTLRAPLTSPAAGAV